ncbi:hypothetical protein C8Q75DRAFT_869790 [Abortiporus biennis]|nr:hypothetical protein C8Q75DRAFT_869790 [Abortiporus biennis]
MRFDTLLPFTLAAVLAASNAVNAAPSYTGDNELYIRDEQLDVIARSLAPAVADILERRGMGQSKPQRPYPTYPANDVRNRLQFIETTPDTAIGWREVKAKEEARARAKAERKKKGFFGRFKKGKRDFDDKLFARSEIEEIVERGLGQSKPQKPYPTYPDNDVRNRLQFIETTPDTAIGWREVKAKDEAAARAKAEKKKKGFFGKLKGKREFDDLD